MAKIYKPVGDGAVATYENTRPVFVADDLSALHGAMDGTVVLPLRLDWSNSNSYDLSDPIRVRTMYATVLREASSEDDLIAYLSQVLLVREWPRLRLPAFMRQEWERRHPVLG